MITDRTENKGGSFGFRTFQYSSVQPSTYEARILAAKTIITFSRRFAKPCEDYLRAFLRKTFARVDGLKDLATDKTTLSILLRGNKNSL